MQPGPLTIFLNGTVGAGKTTTAAALALVLRGAEVPHAVIDADHLRLSWPVPAEDPFNVEVELRNLESVASNYRAAGVRVLVIAGVIEEATRRSRYEVAAGGGSFLLVRLTASASVRTARLAARHADDPTAAAWHENRTHELEAVLVANAFEDVLIDTSGRSADDVAVEIWEQVAGPRRS